MFMHQNQKYSYDMAGKELMYEGTLHGHYLTISSGWMVILWDLVLITSTTGMVWKDIQSVPANGSRISFISEILYCSSQKYYGATLQLQM